MKRACLAMPLRSTGTAACGRSSLHGTAMVSASLPFPCAGPAGGALRLLPGGALQHDRGDAAVGALGGVGHVLAWRGAVGVKTPMWRQVPPVPGCHPAPLPATQRGTVLPPRSPRRRYLSALRSCFAAGGKEMVGFERYMALRKSGGNHCHFNAIAVPGTRGRGRVGPGWSPSWGRAAGMLFSGSAKLRLPSAPPLRASSTGAGTRTTQDRPSAPVRCNLRHPQLRRPPRRGKRLRRGRTAMASPSPTCLRCPPACLAE